MVKKFTKHVFFTIFVLMVVVFVTGMLLGRHMEKSTESEISYYLTESELSTESYLIEQALIKTSGDKGCSLAKSRIDDLSEQLGKIGRRLSMKDVDKILGAADYSVLKRQYHLMQIRTYLMYQQLMDSCDLDRDIFLFYYGVDGGKSQEQGKVLDRLVLDKGIVVFALEYNYSEELDFLETFYNITSTPSIVINHNITLTGLQDYDTIAAILE